MFPMLFMPANSRLLMGLERKNEFIDYSATDTLFTSSQEVPCITNI